MNIPQGYGDREAYMVHALGSRLELIGKWYGSEVAFQSTRSFPKDFWRHSLLDTAALPRCMLLCSQSSCPISFVAVEQLNQLNELLYNWRN